MAALAKAAQQGMTEEQKKKAESSQKEHEKIKCLNATLAQAKELEGAGNYDQAITILQQATQAAPNQDLIWAYLGDAQRGGQEISRRRSSPIRRRWRSSRTSVPTWQGLADAYAKSGQTDKAVEQYAAAAAADPANAATFYFNEGAVFTNIGKADEAIAAFDKSIQLDPNRADAYYWKGMDLIGKINHWQGRQDGSAGRYGRGLQQISGAGAERKVCRHRQADAGHASARPLRPATGSRSRAPRRSRHARFLRNGGRRTRKRPRLRLIYSS